MAPTSTSVMSIMGRRHQNLRKSKVVVRRNLSTLGSGTPGKKKERYPSRAVTTRKRSLLIMGQWWYLPFLIGMVMGRNLLT